MRRFPHLPERRRHGPGRTFAGVDPGPRAGAPRRAAGCALAGHRPRLRAADGAHPAPVPDRAADRRAGRSRRGDALVDLLLGPPRERGLPHRRARAGEVVRRRHRGEGDEVRSGAVQRRPTCSPCCGCWLGQHTTAPDPGRHRLRRVGAQGARRDDRRGTPELARSLGEELALGPDVLDALASSYERWDGKGYPSGRVGDQVPMASRIVQLAEFLEVAHRNDGIDGALDLARRRSGSQFDPALVEVVVADAEKVFHGLDELDAWGAVIDGEPALARMLSQAECDEALAAIGRYVDVKSPYTARALRGRREPGRGNGRRPRPPGHRPAARAAGRDSCRASAGWESRTRSGTRLAPLTAPEWERVRLYPAYTERMLRRSPALEPAGRLAGQVAERLDGSGYPGGLAAPALSLPSRILATDRGVPDQARGPAAPAGAQRGRHGAGAPRTRSEPAGSTVSSSTRCCARPASGSSAARPAPRASPPGRWRCCSA